MTKETTKACLESKFLSSLESNTIYVANGINEKYSCPQPLCSEIGSFANPCDTIDKAFLVIEKRYSPETKITVSFQPGSYKIPDSILIPKNVTTMISALGNCTIEGDLSLLNHSTLKIINIDIVGNIELISNAKNQTAFYLEKSKFKGRYSVNVEDEATKTLIFETVSQTIEKATDTQVYGNEIVVKGSGSVVIKVLDCITESKLKAKVDLSGSGKLTREIKNCIVGSPGEDTNYTDESSLLERVTDLEIYSFF